MRIISLDIGTKTIGVAVSDELGITANGVTTIARKTENRDLAELKDIIEKYKPQEILIGIPYNSDGSISKRGKQILNFSQKLEKRFAIPLVFTDESYSTVNAEKFLIEADLSRLKRKKVIDKMAAVIILQEYLETKRK